MLLGTFVSFDAVAEVGRAGEGGAEGKIVVGDGSGRLVGHNSNNILIASPDIVAGDPDGRSCVESTTIVNHLAE